MHVLRLLLGGAGICLWLALIAPEPVSAARDDPERPAQGGPLIFVGEKEIPTPGFVDRGRIFVPVRGVFEAIGAGVTFSPPHFVVVRKDDDIIAAFILDRRHAIVGHRAVELDAAPTRRDGRIYIPLRLIAEAAGATVVYMSRPSAVHIALNAAVPEAPPPDPALVGTAAPEGRAEPISTTRWRLGVAVVTGLCCLGCLVLTARRFAPTLFRPRPGRSPAPIPAEPAAFVAPPLDQVALTSVEATGEARFRKELVTETRTIEVPVTREELVIEYAGDGGTVFIEGRELAAGETVRIPLWEERVVVDVTKHVLLTADIVAGRRRIAASGAVPERTPPPDFSIAEGSPS